MDVKNLQRIGTQVWASHLCDCRGYFISICCNSGG